MAWPTIFANLAGGNQPLSVFDVMFQQVANMISIPCSASGQNSITLSPIGNAPTLTGYSFGNFFRFVAAQTSSGPVQAQFTTLGFANVYKADGLTQVSTTDIIQQQEYVLIYNPTLNSNAGGFYLESAAVPIVASGAASAVSGLTITNNAGTPNTQIDVTIGEITVVNSLGAALRFAPGTGSPAFTINGATNGVNGLDTLALAANQNYSVWAISNGSLLRGLLSLSTTLAGLTLPGGYTFGKRIGTMRTAVANANLMGTLQTGNYVQYRVGLAQTTLSQIPISGTSGNVSTPTYTSQALANFVPANAAGYECVLWMSNNVNGDLGAIAAPTASYGGISSTTNPPPLANSNPLTAGSGQSTSTGGNVKGRFNGAGPVFYASNNAACGIMIDGWYENI